MSSPVEEFIAAHVAGQDPTRYPSRTSEAPRALLSRAARRRSIHAKRMYQNQHVLMRGSRIVGGFDVTLTTLVSAEALEASQSRALARTYLEAAGIPTASWNLSKPSEMRAAEKFLHEQQTVFVRPNSSRGGAGITSRVSTSDALGAAMMKAAGISRDGEDAAPKVLVEQQISGLALRAYVVHEQVLSVMARLPFFVIGDGASSVEELAEQVAASRQGNPLLGRYPLNVQAMLEGSPAPQRIPSAGEVVFLSDEVNIQAGGLTVDVTTLVSNDLLHTAIEACWSLPGARMGAVDFLVDSAEAATSPYVTDVDAEASFTPHHYPWMGKGRPVADSIMQAISRR